MNANLEMDINQPAIDINQPPLDMDLHPVILNPTLLDDNGDFLELNNLQLNMAE